MSQYIIKEPTIKAELQRIALECATKHHNLSEVVMAKAIEHALYDALSASSQHSQRQYELKRKELHTKAFTTTQEK